MCPRGSLRGKENISGGIPGAEQSSRHGNAGMLWTAAVGFVFAKYGERFVNGQKIREGAVKSALQPIVFAVWCRVTEEMLRLPLGLSQCGGPSRGPSFQVSRKVSCCPYGSHADVIMFHKAGRASLLSSDSLSTKQIKAVISTSSGQARLCSARHRLGRCRVRALPSLCGRQVCLQHGKGDEGHSVWVLGEPPLV